MSFDPYILKDVKRELKTEQTRRTMSCLKALDDLSGSSPRLREINVQLHSSFINYVENPHNDEASGDRGAELLAERDSILLANGYKPSELSPSVCPLCRGELYLDGAPCECLKKAYAEAQTRRLSETLDIDRMSFENFDFELYSGKTTPEYGISPRSNMEILYEKCADYAAGLDRMPAGLFFNGGVGLGKTFLSACIAGGVSRNGFWTVYETAINMFAVMESQKFDREDADPRAARAYLDCDLLVIDDLGTEFPSPFIQTALYHVVNTRLCARRKTIINSNLTLEEFRQRYAPQTMSRIDGEYELMFFFGQDLRTL